jgi:general secretion pathway protein H
MNANRSVCCNGFSLFELLLVLVIASLAFALAGGQLGKSLTKVEGVAAVRRLAASLRYTRSQAIAKGQNHLISFDLGMQSYSLEDLGQAVPLPDGWYFHEVKGIPGSSKQEASLVFYSDGSSSGGEIQIGHRAKLFQITVDPLLGEVVVQERQEESDKN